MQCVAVCCSVLQCVAVCCSVLQCVNDVGVYLVISGYVYIYTEFVDRVDLSNITNLMLWADLRFGCTLTVDLQRRILEVTCSYVMSRIRMSHVTHMDGPCHTYE